MHDDSSPAARLFVAGPTASGKSAVAMLLAERLGGEIISVDSMQVYRGLDIGTAKPSIAERERVTHHLIDVVNLDENFDAAEFVRRAGAAEAAIKARGKLPVFCGGTGLYLKAYLEGLGSAPPSDSGLRKILEATPLSDLCNELREKDPVTFERIDRQNPRRVIRAVEVIRLTGRSYSGQRASWQLAEDSTAPKHTAEPVYGLLRSGDALKARIDARVDEMFTRGLVNETQLLLDRGLEQNPTAMQAIGYRQVVEYFQGARSLDETVTLIKTRTRQFAKRQMTWFRRQLPMHWIDAANEEDAADRVIAAWQNSGNSQTPKFPNS